MMPSSPRLRHSWVPFTLLVLCVSCTVREPAYTVEKLPDGREIKLIDSGVMHHSSFDGQAFFINYQTDLATDPPEAIVEEGKSIWNALQPEVEPQGFETVVIKASLPPEGGFLQRRTTRWLIFKKNEDGDWRIAN